MCPRVCEQREKLHTLAALLPLRFDGEIKYKNVMSTCRNAADDGTAARGGFVRRLLLCCLAAFDAGPPGVTNVRFIPPQDRPSVSHFLQRLASSARSNAAMLICRDVT